MSEIAQKKICTKCKVEQDVSCFHKNKNRKDGLIGACKICVSEQKKVYYKANIESLREKSKSYYEANIEQIKAYKKSNAESEKAYRLANREALNERQKVYRQTPMGKASKKNSEHKRRALFKVGDVATLELKSLIDNAKVCYWCDSSMKNVKIQVDHYIPLSRGGVHTLSNLVVSCQKCNNQKRAKDPHEFALSIGKLL